jgi:RNA ligase
LLVTTTKSTTSFPRIDNIDQVREAIKGRDEFFEKECEVLTGHGIYKYHVFNYMVSHTDSFDCPVRRECRGLIFDANGKVLSRRFHKFFNLGEKDETFFMNVDWSRPHVLQTKMDGSMITPLVFDREKRVIRWATKMGVTDIGNWVFNFANKDQRYNDLAIEAYDLGVTPIFEYVGPYNRIVLPYAKEDLVLLSVRDNVTGQYMHTNGVESFAAGFKVPVVQNTNFHNVFDIQTKTDIEGVVVAFDDGMKIKVKTEWYCAIHKAKDNLLHEKNVLKLILEEKMDDVLPFLMDHDKQRVLDYQEKLLANIDSLTKMIDTMHEYNLDNGIDRKTFAIETVPTLSKFVASIAFATWDCLKSEIRKHVVKTYLKNTSSQTDVDSIREFIGTHWVPVGDIDG